MGGKSRKSGSGVSRQLIAQLKYGNYQADEGTAADKKRTKQGERRDEKPSFGGFGLLDD